MAMDRLMRCGRDETRLSPEVFINGKSKTYDPVDKNDFWWRDKQRPSFPETDTSDEEQAHVSGNDLKNKTIRPDDRCG